MTLNMLDIHYFKDISSLFSEYYNCTKHNQHLFQFFHASTKRVPLLKNNLGRMENRLLQSSRLIIEHIKCLLVQHVPLNTCFLPSLPEETLSRHTTFLVNVSNNAGNIFPNIVLEIHHIEIKNIVKRVMQCINIYSECNVISKHV